jgi:hypothetical protein
MGSKVINHTATMTVSKLTVAELKAFLEDPQLPANGNVQVSNYSDQREGTSYTVSVKWTT